VTNLAQMLSPQLTTLRIPGDEIGADATRLLVDPDRPLRQYELTERAKAFGWPGSVKGHQVRTATRHTTT
jgi:hypothetical protein